MSDARRIRLCLGIDESLRWISHLEFLRAMIRLLRRSGLPLVYSQGYNPHPRLAFSLPRSTGMSSECEFVDIYLSDPVEEEEIVRRCRDSAPEGLDIWAAREAAIDNPSIMSRINAGRFLLTFRPVRGTREEWNDGLRRMLDARPLMVTRRRRGKSPRDYDLAPLLHRAELVRFVPDDRADVSVDIAQGSGAHVRPEEFSSALARFVPGAEGAHLLVHRRLLYRKDGAREIPLWDL